MISVRRIVGGVGGLLLLAATLGHWWYWYSPRERAGVPVNDLPAQLLGAPGARASFWLPYPHQNLALFEEAVGDIDTYGSVFSRATGGSRPRLPRFGPFLAPPSREIGAAWGEDGEAVVAARVYPAIAGIARLAGRIAGNRWLAGGSVELGGRPAEVAWQGTLWTVRTPGAPTPRVNAGAAAAAPALAALSLVAPPDPLPAGTYRLHRLGSGIEWLLDGTDPHLPAPDGTALAQSGVALLALRGAEGAGEEGPARPPGGLVLLAETGRDGLPAAFTVAPAGVEPWDLPKMSLGDLFSQRVHEGTAAGLTLRASNAAVLRRAEEVAPVLAPWWDPASRLPARPVFVVWADPHAAVGLLGETSRAFSDLPFLAALLGLRREAETIEDLRTLLTPWGSMRHLSFVVTDQPRGARLVVAPSAEAGTL